MFMRTVDTVWMIWVFTYDERSRNSSANTFIKLFVPKNLQHIGSYSCARRTRASLSPWYDSGADVLEKALIVLITVHHHLRYLFDYVDQFRIGCLRWHCSFLPEQ